MTTVPMERWVEIEVRVLGADGAPQGAVDLEIAQLSHAIQFGCTGFEAIELANHELDGPAKEVIERLYERWLEVFNTATLPFYWARFEPSRGNPDSARLATTAAWFRDRGVAVKGHPLCWHTLTPPWLLDLSDTQIERAQVARIQRDVTASAASSMPGTWSTRP